MRTPLFAAAIVLAILTWLSFRGLNSEAVKFDRALQSLDNFGLAERALQRDLLKARVGSLRNYDPLVKGTSDLRASLDALRNDVSGNRDEIKAVGRLASLLDKQDDLAEKFKSKIALLRNSLAYFSMFSGRLGSGGITDRSLPAVNDVSAAMLRLTLDTSTANTREVDEALENLEKVLPEMGDKETARALLAHGRLLRALLPEADQLLGAFFDLPIKAAQEELRTIVSTDALASREQAERYRVLAFFVSLFLLAILVHLGDQLRARARSLKWRAAVEHIIADISTNLIDCGPRETDARLKDALHRLADFIGADRAYFVPARRHHALHEWCDDQSPFAAGWPENALDLARRFDKAAASDVIHLPRVANLPRTQEVGALSAYGVQSWVCVVGGRDDQIDAILGFDARRGALDVPPSDLGILRMALDALQSAISRDSLARETSRLEEQLHQARRVQTIGAFASGVAHNFNNIVGAILGYVEIAESHVASNQPAARSLIEIRRSGFRARNLVEQLLAFGRRRPSQREILRLDAIVSEAHSLLSASLTPDVELCVCNEVIATISGEPAQLQQVILNLCHNAAQAMNEKGRIEISTAVQDIHDVLSLSHAELPKGRYAVISVKDNGRGMTPTIVSQLFEPFFTTRSSGNGLGLATACEIIRGHGGTINVESEPNVGSCFEAWIPCLEPARLTCLEDEDRKNRYGRGEVVLLLEEPPERRLRDEEILAALGFEPIGFSSLSDALSAAHEDAARFDAFLIAYLTSGSATLSLASTLRRLAPNKPIIMAIPSTRKVDVDMLLSAGVSRIVRWPLVPAEIATALTRTLNLSTSTRSSDRMICS